MSNEQNKPKTVGDVVVNKVLGVNAKVETTKTLECGAVLFSINGGESFAAVTSARRSDAGKRRGGAKDRIIQTKNHS